MNEFRVTDQGELDLGLAAPPSSSAPAARPRRVPAAAGAACPPNASQAPAAPQVPDDDWPADCWPAGDWPEPGDDGDPDTSPDDYEAWLAGLPAAVRADFLAGAWTGAGESIPAGFLHHLRAGPAGTGFAAGGVLDTLPPGPVARRRPHHRHRRRRRARRAGRVGADRGAVRVAADRVVGRGRRGRRRRHPRPPPRRR
ncbi:MAG TPA: hypothetical protein VK802_15755 [Streptosporangiaceae bacterium]|nr:hypothetical protein [Streptosporangiaceae bacterium]